MDNEGRGYAKTSKNRDDDDQMDVRCETELQPRKASPELLSRLDRVFQWLLDVIDGDGLDMWNESSLMIGCQHADI